MPTGYTAFIEDGRCNSAKQFLKLCLRNFGILSKYRDESLSLDFEPDFTDNSVNSNISYYEKDLEKYKKQLQEYDNLSYEEKVSQLKKEYTNSLEEYKKTRDEAIALNAKYDKFIEAIDNWDCSEDFKSIRDFAKNQCKISKDDNIDFYERKINEFQRILDKLETNKYAIQYEIELKRKLILDNIKYSTDRINEIKSTTGKEETHKEFYNRFIKELDSVEF